MDKKISFVLFLLVASMLIVPIVVAKPSTEKNNDKFEFFQLVVSGTGDGDPDKLWYTPPNVPIEENKTTHTRGAGWITGDTVELTVGSETYTLTTSPINVTYTTTYDADVVRNNDGTMKLVHVRLTDVVTVYVDNVAIGTLVLNIKAMGVVGDEGLAYSGNIVGYGTDALEGVHIVAVDVVLPPTYQYTRIGTITGWPL